SSRVGTLLLLEGLLVAFSSLAGSRNPGVHVVGFLAGCAAAIGVVWLVVAFPRTRPKGAGWAVVSLALAAFTFGELPFVLTSSSAPIASAAGQCAGACPTNPIQLVDAPGANAVFGDVESVLQAIAAVALLAYMALHFMQASRPRRRKLAFVYAAMVPFGLAVAI